MPIRKPKPTSPGRRFVTYPDFAEITKSEPEKTLVEGLKKSGGRNVNGRKTARHRGGGAKRLYRKMDFKRSRKDGVPARVAAIEYDPNRSAYIALLHYLDGEKSYILAPNRLRVGMTVQSGAGSDITVGNAMPLALMPVGTLVHNVELQPGRGGQLGRSAGAGIQLMAKEGGMATLRLPSGEMRMVRAECRATVSVVGNADHQNVTVGNAMPLAAMPVGTLVHNVELQPGRGAQMARSAGAGIQLMAKEGGMATLRLPSGEMRMVRDSCRATVGVVGNADHQNIDIGKAGRKRHMGVRPQTRGTAMNPVDHPHGGGEGSTTPGRHPVTPWGVPTLGYRTRKKNKPSDRMIVRRRRKKR